MRNSFTREGGSTIFRTPSAESSLSYWREGSVFLQINQVTEECSISGVFNFSLNFAIHRGHFPISNWFRQRSTLTFSRSDLTLILFPSHLLKKRPWRPWLSLPRWAAAMLPSHLGSSSSLTQWLVSSSELLPESASSPCSQLPQIPSLPSLIYSVAATSSPGRLTSSLPLTPHSIPLSSPPEPQDQPTHCSTAKQAPNPPTTPGFPKSSPKTLKWPSRPINLHPTNHHPSQHSPFMLYKVTLLAKQC